jgi:hypothetical protein
MSFHGLESVKGPFRVSSCRSCLRAIRSQASRMDRSWSPLAIARLSAISMGRPSRLRFGKNCIAGKFESVYFERQKLERLVMECSNTGDPRGQKEGSLRARCFGSVGCHLPRLTARRPVLEFGTRELRNGRAAAGVCSYSLETESGVSAYLAANHGLRQHNIRWANRTMSGVARWTDFEATAARYRPASHAGRIQMATSELPGEACEK